MKTKLLVLLPFISLPLIGCGGNKTPHVHEFQTTYTYDEEFHWYKCNECEERKNVAAHSFKPWEQISEDETTITYKADCYTCDYYKTKVEDKHIHSFSTEWDSDDNYHWHNCSGCTEISEKASHNFSNKQVISETDTTITYKLTCSTCNHEKTVTDNISGDNYVVSDYYNGYYENIVSWVDSQDLINQLYQLLRTDYHPLSYADPNWESNQFADEDLYLSDSVDVLYSGDSFLKSATNSGWQREHAFAASLMTGFTSTDAVGATGRATDFHNLFAAYATGNTSRGNKNFGIANPNDPGYQAIGSGKGVQGDYSCDTNTFEPSNYDKGRIARALFYMGVMYSQKEENIDVSSTLTYSQEDAEKYGKKSTTVHFNMTYEPLTIVEENVPYTKITYKDWYYETNEDIKAIKQSYNGTNEETYAQYSHDNCKFAIGHLSTLLDWANTYDVDYEEVQHNESVYSHVYTKREVAQGNRNPFIDYPELVDYIYGEKKDLPGTMSFLVPTQETLKTNSKDINHYALDNIDREFAVGEILKEGTSYKIMEVSKDGSKKAISTSLNSDYTFTNEDVGSKEITIKTPMNDIKYKVTVTKAGNSESSWKHVLSGYNGDFKDKNTAGTEHIIDMDGVNWSVYWEEGEIGSATTAPSYGGVKFGKNATSPVKTLRFKTVNSFSYNSLSKISSIVFEGNTASSCSYDYVIKVGDEVVKTAKITYSADPKIKEYAYDLPEAKEGIIVVEFTNITNAIYINSLGVILTK